MDLKKTGRLIIKKRKDLNLTQEHLSEGLCVTLQAVSLWEKGKRFPDPAALVMIHISAVVWLYCKWFISRNRNNRSSVVFAQVIIVFA